jgi:hypothetical protein
MCKKKKETDDIFLHQRLVDPFMCSRGGRRSAPVPVPVPVPFEIMKIWGRVIKVCQWHHPHI